VDEAITTVAYQTKHAQQRRAQPHRAGDPAPTYSRSARTYTPPRSPYQAAVQRNIASAF